MTQKSRLALRLDTLMLCCAAFFISYLWFLSSVQNQMLSILLSLVAAGMFLVAHLAYRSMKLDKFITRYTKELYETALQEHMLLMSQQQAQELLLRDHNLRQFKALPGAFCAERKLYAVLLQHPNEPVAPSQLLSLYRLAIEEDCNELHLYSTADYREETRALSKQFVEVAPLLHEPNELTALAGEAHLLPTDEAVHRAIEEHILARQRKKKAVRRGMLVSANTKRFLICALVIMAASWVTGYRVYYPMMASVCLCLALVSWYISWQKKRIQPRNADSETQEAPFQNQS